MQSKHTPMPWEQSADGMGIIGPDQKLVAQVTKYGPDHIGKPGHISIQEAKANARFIVRAVNEYDELKKTEIAYREACIHRKELLEHNTKLRDLHEALLEAVKRIVFKNGKERMIGSETAEDRDALKQVIAQAEEWNGCGVLPVSGRITKPMLAETCKNFEALKFPLLATPKLDGIRCLVLGGRALSRKFKEIPNRYIQALVSQLPDGLDGELMLRPRTDIVTGAVEPEPTFQQVSSAVMSEDGEPNFVYCVFDYCPSALTERYAARMELLRALDLPSFVTKILPATVMNLRDLEAMENSCLSKGFEGVMVRDPHGPYKCGRSTEKEQWLLKIKRFEDAEAEVIGFEERLHNSNEATTDELGHTKRSSHKANLVAMDTLGSLKVRDLKTGIVFNIGTGFDDATRKEIWANRELTYQGAIVKYKSQPTGVKDAPRFPVFLGFRDRRDM